VPIYVAAITSPKMSTFGESDQKMFEVLRKWLPWALFLTGFFLVIAARDSSSSFRQCANKEMDTNRIEQDKSSLGIIDSLALRTRISWRCTGDFIEQNDAAITAIATVFIAAFTITLWRATSAQGRLTLKAIELGNKEFIATHRPKIVARNFGILGDEEIPGGKQIQFFFVAHNIGETRASVIEVRSGTLILKKDEKIPSNVSFPFREKFNFRLESGEREIFSGNGGGTPNSTESMGIFAGELVLLCLGVIVYTDDNGTQRETGFCRRFRSRENDWDVIHNSDYEYGY